VLAGLKAIFESFDWVTSMHRASSAFTTSARVGGIWIADLCLNGGTLFINKSFHEQPFIGVVHEREIFVLRVPETDHPA
jgi:hypothetical protein